MEHHEMKEKVKTVLQTSEKDTRNEIEWWEYYNRNKYMGNFITNRGGSRTAATSKMEHFVTIITKSSILGVAAVLHPPLTKILCCLSRANGQENKTINENASGIES